MRRILAVLLALGWAGAALAEGEAPYPNIWSPKQVLDIGVVRPNTKTDCEFSIQNLGEAPLHLGRVTTTCGCTLVELSAREIPPRGEAKLKVQYTSGPVQERTQKHIKVESDDPRRPVLTFTLKVRVLADMSWQPQEVHLDWPVPDSFTGRITFTASGTDPVRLGAVAAEQGFLQTRIDANDARQAVVLFTLPPGAAFRTQDVIRIETGSRDFPEVRVPVYFQKPSPFNLTPGRISLWMHAGDEPPVRRFTLGRKDGQPVKIRSVTPSHKRLMAVVVEDGGGAAILEVTLRPGVEAGPCDGSLHIVTDAGELDVNIACDVVNRGKTPDAR
jgi:hypothetical protein